jgi:hypothetical protein
VFFDHFGPIDVAPDSNFDVRRIRTSAWRR